MAERQQDAMHEGAPYPMPTHGTRATTAGVVGGGTMGSGIARWLVARGCDVVLQTRQADAATRFLAEVERDRRRAVRRGKVGAEESDAWRRRVRATHTFAGFADCEIIIEAVVEDLEVKGQVLRTLERVSSDDTVIGTTTSSITVAALAAAMAHPDRLVGLHFFNPVETIRLVEVARSQATSRRAFVTAVRVLEAVDLVPLLVQDRVGFLANRLLCPLLFEALRVCEEGIATPEEVDGACVDWGMRIGPCAMADLVGLDVILAICRNFERDLGSTYRPPELLQDLVTAGRLGRKSGAGIFAYERGRSKLAAPQRPAGQALQVDRLVAPLVHEALRCMADGIAERANIDRVMAEVLGWPSGPLARLDPGDLVRQAGMANGATIRRAT